MLDLLNNHDMLPALSVPSWATSLIGSGVQGEDATHLASQNYPIYLMLNIVDRNPDGLNGLIDALLSGVFGARLAQAVAFIDALPDDASVTVPDAYPDRLRRGRTHGPRRHREVRARCFSAALEATKSFVQLLASYNLNYPLSALHLNFATRAHEPQRHPRLGRRRPLYRP